jgi:hypothetical protein
MVPRPIVRHTAQVVAACSACSQTLLPSGNVNL